MKIKKDYGIKFTCKSTGEYVLFEGTSKSLEFIGKIFIKQSEDEDCQYHISPWGAGKMYFNKESNRGLLIHKLPCSNGKIKLSHKKVIEEFKSELKPAKFENIFSRVQKQWPKTIDISDGYIIEETNGYYSSNLSEVYGITEDKLDPTNEWDILLCWTLFGILHKKAKEIEKNNFRKKLFMNKISMEEVKNAYILDLNTKGRMNMFKLFKKANPK